MVESFGKRLKALREEKHMTLEEVAEAVGVSRATIYKYETGAIKVVPPDKVHRLANLFGVTSPYLMAWTDERKVNPSENLDMVAERLRDEANQKLSQKPGYWKTIPLSTRDCTTAATQAARCLVKFGISRAPVYPHQVLQQSRLATMISFENVEELDEVIRNTRLSVVRHTNDMVMSTVYTNAAGQERYIFAVNRDAPLGKNRLVLAVELGHIYLGHTWDLMDAGKMYDAECFAIHLEFPRALIRLLEEKGYVFTRKSFSRIFGDCEWCLESMMMAEPVTVSPELNRMIKEQFLPHVGLLEETGILEIPVGADEERLDLSRYMAGYEE